MSVDIVANYTSLGADPMGFAREVEAQGFAGVSCADHVFRTAAYPHVWVTLAAMACATERVTISPSFANNLLRSPVEFVQAGLTLQALSGGRYEAGLGAGWLAAEVTGSGLPYPPPAERARRYREAVLIARALLRAGHCRFQGEFYDIDVPVIGPMPSDAGLPPVPLVASLGGPWTIRHIAPLVDRVEIKFGRTTRDGALSMEALASVTRDELAASVAAVREVAPDVPIGVFTMIAVGTDAEVAPLRTRVGDQLYGSFIGSREQVLDSLRSLAEFGIDRVQVSELLKGSIVKLGPLP